MNYPKIQTYFNRDNQTFKVKEDEVRQPEFKQIRRWYVTEKIHGRNIRIILEPVMNYEGSIGLGHMESYSGEDEITFTGRTDKAQLPGNLMKYLYNTFSVDKLRKQFPLKEDEIPGTITLFGEGFGAKINGGGNLVSAVDNNGFDTKFRLFDVYIEDYNNALGGWWLEPDAIQDVADGLGIETVPCIGLLTAEECVQYVKETKNGNGICVTQSEDNPRMHFPEYKVPRIIPEGIVARTYPMLFTRRGKRLMFKLKCSDFTEEKQ